MALLLSLLAAAGRPAAAAATAATGRTVLETSGPLRDGWTHSSAEQPSLSCTLVITAALTMQPGGLAAMRGHLAETSDPALPQYGSTRHWTLEQLDRNRPRAAELSGGLVAAWLTGCGAKLLEQTHGFIRAELGVAAAEGCFGVELAMFTHAATGQSAVATSDAYKVPVELAPLIDFIAGLRPPAAAMLRGGQAVEPLATAVGAARTGHSTADEPAFSLNPAVVRKLYSLPAAAAIPKSANRQAVVAFNNESYQPADLAAFQRRNGLPAQAAVNLGPAVLPKGGTGEGELDVEWLMGVAPTIPTTVSCKALSFCCASTVFFLRQCLSMRSRSTRSGRPPASATIHRTRSTTTSPSSSGW
eukprot:SAG22_NODE_64_length_23238_cov_83.185566_1_plen_359_part_00